MFLREHHEKHVTNKLINAKIWLIISPRNSKGVLTYSGVQWCQTKIPDQACLHSANLFWMVSGHTPHNANLEAVKLIKVFSNMTQQLHILCTQEWLFTSSYDKCSSSCWLRPLTYQGFLRNLLHEIMSHIAWSVLMHKMKL